MTKEEIDKIFNSLEKGNIECIVNFIKDKDLKKKVGFYKNFDKFLEIEGSSFYIDIYSQVPEELKKYYCYKAINEENEYMIPDDEVYENYINEYEKHIDKILKSSDDEKLNMLDIVHNNRYREQIAISICNPRMKLKSLEKFGDKEDYCKAKIVETIENSSIALMALDMLSDIDKTRIAKGIIGKESDKAKEKIGQVTKIGIPKNMTFGIEIEVEGRIGEYIIGEKIDNRWEGKLESNIDGVELVSLILKDNEEDIQSLEIICETIQNLGLESTERCGGHIHIGAGYLEHNPKALENLVTIWNECEELFYKICNEEENAPREDIIKWAHESHSYIETMFPGGKISIKDESSFIEMCSELKERKLKYRGLNLDNYNQEEKNTIEFRIPNSSLNPKTIKENVKLFGSLMQVSKEMALDSKYKSKEFAMIKDRSLTEGEKLEVLLDLLFDDEKTKSVYRERWNSVKDERIFDEIIRGGVLTFERGNYNVRKVDMKKVASSKEAIQEMESVARELKETKTKENNKKLENKDNSDEAK